MLEVTEPSSEEKMPPSPTFIPSKIDGETYLHVI